MKVIKNPVKVFTGKTIEKFIVQASNFHVVKFTDGVIVGIETECVVPLGMGGIYGPVYYKLNKKDLKDMKVVV